MNEAENATTGSDGGPALREGAADENADPLGLERPPYPGPRPFRRNEMEIFFGRDRALDLLIDRLAGTKFLTVLGPSGCGTTSLVRAGLYNALELGLLASAGSRWKIAELNPGRRPLRNLARALAEVMPAQRPVREEQDAVPAEDLIVAHLKRGPRAIVDLGEGELLADGGNLLIVVDRFEEVFRFRDDADREEAEAFVALLLESARSALPIYIVATLRSEFVAACALVPGLAEQISQAVFLTPRMTRDEYRQAIEGPAAIRGIDIEPELVARILNDLHGFSAFDRRDGLDQAVQLLLQGDQLPLMQHMLDWIWRRAMMTHHPAAPRLTLRLRDYEEVGGLIGALDNLGNEILARLKSELGGDVENTVERVFRALVDGPDLPFAVRRPRRFGELVAAAGGEEKRDAVARIVEAFRRPDCNFLRVSGGALTDRMMVDIGHESLIRHWARLREWFAAEVEAGALWRRLSQDAALYDAGMGELLGGLGLRRWRDWWEAEKPAPAIAERYGGDFERIRAFLDASLAAEKRRRRVERWTRIGLAIAGLATIILLIIAVGLLVARD